MFATTILGVTLSAIWAVIILFIWIAIAFWPARVAARKGHSFIGFFLLSLLFFPLSLLLAYLSGDISNQHSMAQHTT
jgi:energy-coupling factor transporter transmembrane protein EcfT